MNNLDLYEKLKSVPKEAQKQFNNGRFSGTDINSMWRIKKLTETFGPCGIGWYTEILEQWIEKGKEEELIANVKIALYIKQDNEWSKPIIGIGGNKLATFESKKQAIYVSDECYKMAYTDAIGSACKMLGMGADVYWQEDRTKYSATENEGKSVIKTQEENKKPEIKKETNIEITEQQIKILVANSESETVKKALAYYKKEINQLTITEASTIIKKLLAKKEEK